MIMIYQKFRLSNGEAIVWSLSIRVSIEFVSLNENGNKNVLKNNMIETD